MHGYHDVKKIFPIGFDGAPAGQTFQVLPRTTWMITILPFEKTWYESNGISKVEYVGSPLSMRSKHSICSGNTSWRTWIGSC